MHTLKRWALAVVAVLAFVVPGQSQISSTGKTFYMSFMEMETRSGGYPDSLLIYVTSEFNTKIKLDNPRVAGSLQTINITKNTVNRVAVDPQFYYPVGSEFNASDLNSKRGMRIIADDPVNVYCMNLEQNRSAATFVMPYESIPTAPEFFVPSYVPNVRTGFGGNQKYMQSEFVIIGMDNNVKVEITPAYVTAGGKTAGSAYTVTLAKGQVYQVQSDDGDGDVNSPPSDNNSTGAIKGDMTGTRIRVVQGCGKINVFSGNRSGFVDRAGGTCGALGRDHMYTQVIPTNALGKDYVLMPFKGQTGGYVYKIIAAHDSTDVYINGSFVMQLKNAGDWLYRNVTGLTATCIKTSKGAYCVQYMKNGQCSGYGGNRGDASILVMPDATQQLLKTVVGTATTNNMNLHWVNILVRKTATKAVKVNGSFISSNNFTTVCNDYAFAMVQVGNPSYNTIECDSGMVCVAYGIGQFESYAYSAGALFENVEFDFDIKRNTKCPGETVTIEAKKSYPNVTAYLWNFGDGNVGSGKSVKHKFEKVGSYYVVMKLVVPGNCNVDDTIYRSKIVNVLPGPIFNFPDTTVQCTNTVNLKLSGPASSKFLYKWQDSSTAQTFTAKAAGKVWLKILDTSTNCINIDSTLVLRADPIIAKISYDTLNQCGKQNYFSMSDSTKFNNDAFGWATWDLFDWNRNLFVKSAEKRFMYSFDTAGSFDIRYIVSSKLGCRDTLDTALLVEKMPIARINIPQDYYCQYAKADFLDSSIYDLGVLRAVWQFSDGSRDTAAPYLYNYHFQTFDTFDVRLIAESIYNCRDTADSTIIVHPAPIADFTINIDNPCLKQNSFDFDDASSIPYGTYDHAWYLEGAPNASSSLSNYKFKDTGYEKVMLIAVSDQGCADTIEKSVFIAKEPKAKWTITDSNVCFASHFFDLEDNSESAESPNAMNAKNNWYFGDGTTATGSPVKNKTFSASGMYFIKLVAQTNYGCKDSLERMVNVRDNPDATITPANAVQCLNGNEFSFKSLNNWSDGGVNITHQWDLGDGYQVDVDSVKHSYSDTGTYTIRHGIVTKFGCWDSATTKAYVVATPSAQIATDKDTACFGTHAFNFSDMTNFNGSYNRKWYLGDGTTSTQVDVIGKNYAAAGKYTVKLVITSLAGCGDSTERQVELFPVPKASFTVNDLTQCLQNNLFVVNNTSNENGATGVQHGWALNGSPLSLGKVLPNQSYTDTGAYLLTLVLMSDKGCYSSDQQTLMVYETPIVSITGSDGCVGKAIDFLSNVQLSRGSITSYAWTFGDGGTAVIANPQHTYSTAGAYNVELKVQSDQGCQGVSNTLLVNAWPKPVANFDSEYLLSRGLETDWKFTNLSSNADNYSWSFQDGQFVSGAGPHFMTFSSTGDFLVRLLASNNYGCFDSTEKFIFLKPELLFHVPNAFSPNLDGLNEGFKGSSSFGIENYKMRIIDRWGAIIFETTNPEEAWDGSGHNGAPPLEGVYAYQIYFRYVDGNLYVYKGTVTLLD
jgi:gliding motility-associated-like protein